jgi:hypothetical protein
MAEKSSKPRVSVDLETALPKKKVVRFETSEDGPLSNIYLSNEAVAELGGAENGVKVTITAL